MNQGGTTLIVLEFIEFFYLGGIMKKIYVDELDYGDPPNGEDHQKCPSFVV